MTPTNLCMIYQSIAGSADCMGALAPMSSAFARIGLLSSVPVVSIVDDDESVRVATAKLVRLHGFVAHAFASAEEFLASSRLDETSCLITDVRCRE